MSVTSRLITYASHRDIFVIAEVGCSLGFRLVKDICSGCKEASFCAERGKIPCAAPSLSGVHVLLQEPWAQEQQRPPQSTGRCVHG